MTLAFWLVQNKTGIISNWGAPVATRRTLPKLDVHLGNVHRKKCLWKPRQSHKTRTRLSIGAQEDISGAPECHMVTTTRRTVNHANGANVETKQKKCSRVELRQWMCRISDIKKKTAAKDVTIWISQKLERGMFLSLWVTWSLGIIVWSLRLDRSLTYEVFRFLGDGGDLVVKSPFECAKQLPRRKAEVSALTLQPQVLLSKASPRCHSLAGGRREVKWESSCSNDNNNNNIICQGCGSRAH